MLNFKEKISVVTGVRVDNFSDMSWGDFDRVTAPGWNLLGRYGQPLISPCLEPLSSRDIRYIRARAKKILSRF